MTAIFRRELLSYFSSPIGYIFLSVFYFFSGFYFFAGTLAADSTSITPVFSSLFTIVLFLIPILTMRLLSEDKKHRTDQALLTAPISLTGLVLGKFLAAVFVFLLGLAITLVFGVVVAMFATPNWAHIWGNFVALLLMGMALISIGLFISSTTENQVIAAIGGFAVGLALIMVDSMASIVSAEWLSNLFLALSFYQRYSTFTVGMFGLSDVVYFLSVSAIFVFLTVRVLEKRRWS